MHLEQLPDSRLRTGAPVLGVSCEGQLVFGSCSLTNLV